MTSKLTGKAFQCYVLAVLSIFLTGCATNGVLARPDLLKRIPSIKSVALLPPRVDVYELGLIGEPERIADWSNRAAANIVAAASSQLKSTGRIQSERLVSDSLSEAQKEELREVQSLLDAVRTSIRVHIQGGMEQRLPDRQSYFEYSLGMFTELNKSANADAFLVIQGVDQITSPGNRALTAALILTSVAAAGAARTVMIPFVNLGATWVTASLVDSRTGDILWHRTEMSSGRYDLRDSDSTAGFVRKLFEGFPL